MMTAAISCRFFLCTIDFHAALHLFRLTNQIQSDWFSVHTAVKQTDLTHMGPPLSKCTPIREILKIQFDLMRWVKGQSHKIAVGVLMHCLTPKSQKRKRCETGGGAIKPNCFDLHCKDAAVCQGRGFFSPSSI